jgi:hypothetical protein
MPAFARFTFYIAVAAVAFVIGRYALPGTSRFTDPDLGQRWDAAAQTQFWQSQLVEIMTAPSTPELKRSRFVGLMDRMQVEDFPAVLAAVKSDRELAALTTAAWAGADAAGCFKYLAANGGRTPEDLRLATILIVTWAGKDFRSAEAAASRLRVPGVSPDPMLAVATALLRQDVRKGLAYLQAGKLSLSDEVLLQELQVTNLQSPRWQKATAEERMDFLQEFPPSAWQETALSQLAAAWLAQSPELILQQAQQSGRAMNLVPKATQLWLEKDPTKLAEYFAQSAKHQVKGLVGLALAKAMAEQSPEAAWEFAQTALQSFPRTEAKRAILQALIQKDPAAAAAWLVDSADAPWRNELLVAVKNRWQALDATAASQWFNELSSKDQRLIQLATPPAQ